MSTSTRGPKPSPMGFLFATIVLDMLGAGVVIPSLPQVVKRLVEDADKVAHFYGVFVALYPCVQFFSGPILGALSDKHGRRPILLLSLLSACFNYLVMAFAPSLGFLFVGRALAGLSGASVAVASAYVADISNGDDRAKNFGLMGAAVGLGLILGPILGGLVARSSYEAPFVLASLLNLVNFFFGLFTLPETRQKKDHRLEYAVLNPFRVLGKLFKNPRLQTLLLSYFFFSFAGQTHLSLWSFYTHLRFDWGPEDVGASLALVGVLAAFSQAWLTRLFSRRWSEIFITRFGILGQALGYFLFGFANQGWMIIALLFFATPFWPAGPAFQSILTRQVSDAEQGELQGGLMSLNCLVSVINPLVMTNLLGVGFEFATPFLGAGAACLIAWALVLNRRFDAR